MRSIFFLSSTAIIIFTISHPAIKKFIFLSAILFTNSIKITEVDFDFSHFFILFYFIFDLFSYFLYIEHKVMVSHVTQKEKHRKY